MKGVVKEGRRLYTIVPKEFEGRSLYGEKIIKSGGMVLRNWNPYRSKLAAAILKGIDIEIMPDYSILYLGAGAGTTASHLSDIVSNGAIYAVELSAFALKKLLEICRRRNNLIPILADAARPDTYSAYVDKVDLLYQDISQKNQVDIFLNNCDFYLDKGKKAILMVKAKSIDVTMDPEKVYKNVAKQVEGKGYRILKMRKLYPYARDHSVLFIEKVA